jgi:A/G-specific adenine glycosylase
MDSIAGKLLEWYRENKRDLPWRRTKDPYAVWVSEIMLQQTRVDTAVGYYLRFMERFPDVESLAAAAESDVLNVWKGLGYYSRARNMMLSAREIADKYGGRFPGEYRLLSKLPGIGAYTAGAVASIAFGLPVPAVDGNVMRVVSRLYALREDIAKPAAKGRVGEIVSGMIPREHAGDFTQALMELGALICLPVSPRCVDCPLRPDCAAYAGELTDMLPVKGQSRAPHPVLAYWVFAVWQGDRLLMQFRGGETLLSRMWGLPMAEKKEGESPELTAEKTYGLILKDGRLDGRVKHVFTHRTWDMSVMEYKLAEAWPETGAFRWVDRREIETLPIPTAFKKVLKIL